MIITTDVIVIGGGAAGIAAAVKCAERQKNVILLEKSDRPGRKILASGNGRCNLMNTGTPRYYGDSHFAAGVLSNCPAEEIKAFFNHYGLVMTEEDDGRVYPVSGQSATVLQTLKTAMKHTGVRVQTAAAAKAIKRADDRFRVNAEDGCTYESAKVILACGGAAQPRLGGGTDGYSLLASLGHTIIPARPALVPLVTDTRSISGLSGIRFRCRVSLYDNDSVLHNEEGEVLFTDYGISGICVMQCARFTEERNTQICLDLLYRVFPDSDQAMTEFRRKRTLFPEQPPQILLDGILPARLAYAVLKQAGIPMHGETVSELTDRDLETIIRTALRYRMTVKGNRGFEYAQVAAGGAACDDFDPHTMESKLVPGLHAAGEVLNVDGDCGGFNLMFAFATGLIAGKSI